MVKAIVVESKLKLSDHVDLTSKLGFPEVKLSTVCNERDIAEMVRRESPEILILNDKKFEDDISELLQTLMSLKDKPLVLVSDDMGNITSIYDLRDDVEEVPVKKCSQEEFISKVRTVLGRKKSEEKEICGS